MPNGYDAFISYSRAADDRLAAALQRALQRFAKPWYRLRALKVFRDKTSLSAAPGLWPSIENALRQSRYFILLASPLAAQSKWVTREIAWWLEHRAADSLLIVLTDGRFAWDDVANDIDWTGTDALPAVLGGRFAEEPLYVDLRHVSQDVHLSTEHSLFRAAVLDLAAPVRGVPKDDLDGEDVRQHRATRRWAGGAIASLVLLTAASMTAGWIAMQQRDIAEHRQQLAVARQLAVQSQVELNSSAHGLERSLLLATASLQRADTREGRSAWARGIGLAAKRLSFEQAVASRIGFVPSTGALLALTWHGRPCVREIGGAPGPRCFDHPADAGHARLSADATRLLADGSDGATTLWNLASGELELRVVHGQRDVVSVLSPDNQRLAISAAHAPGGVLMDVAGKRVIAQLDLADLDNPAGFGDDSRVLFSMNGRSFTRDGAAMREGAAVSDDFGGNHLPLAVPGGDLVVVNGTVVDPDDGSVVARLELAGPVALSPDGRWLAARADETSATVRIWETATWQVRASFSLAGEPIVLAFSNDARHLATASYAPLDPNHADIRAWQVGPDDYGELAITEVARMGMTARVEDLRFSPDDTRLAGVDADGWVGLWDLRSGAPVQTSGQGSHCALATDGSRAVVVGDDGRLQVLGLPSLQLLDAVPVSGDFSEIAISRDGQWVALLSSVVDAAREAERERHLAELGARHGWPERMYRNLSPMYFTHTIEVWSVADRALHARRQVDSQVQRIAISDDGRWLAAKGATNSSEVMLWDLQRDAGPDLLAPDGELSLLLFHPNGQWLLLGTTDHVRIVQLAGRREIARVAHRGPVTALVLSAAGDLVASADKENEVLLWELPGGDVRRRLPSGASGLAFSPNGERLAVANVRSGISLWNVASGERRHRQAHGDAGYARWDAVMGFDPAGQRLVSSRSDDTVRVWDLADWHEAARYEFSGHDVWVDALHLDSARGFLAICGNLGTRGQLDPRFKRSVQVWDLAVDGMIERACDRLGRDLSEIEWVRYMGDEPQRPVCPRNE